MLYGRKFKNDNILSVENGTIIKNESYEKIIYKVIDGEPFEVTEEEFVEMQHKVTDDWHSVQTVYGVRQSILKRSVLDNLITMSVESSQKYDIKFLIVISSNTRELLDFDELFVEDYQLYRLEIFIYDLQTSCQKYQDTLLSPDAIYEMENKIYDMIQEIIKYRKLQVLHLNTNYKYKLLFTAPQCGILLHEAIGHYVEFDNYSSFSHKFLQMGSKLIAASISVSDFCEYDSQGQLVPIPIKYDDFGHLCRDVQIIKNGVLIDTLSSKYGNQFITAEYKKIDRMKNLTCNISCLSNKKSIKISTYVLVKGTGYAYCTKKGNIEIEVTESYFCSSGSILGRLPLFYIKTNTLDLLSSLRNAGEGKNTWIHTRCVKQGSEKLVGMGGVAMECTMNISYDSWLYRDNIKE